MKDEGAHSAASNNCCSFVTSTFRLAKAIVIERATSARQLLRIQHKHVMHALPFLEHHVRSCLGRGLGEVSGVISQNFVRADLNKAWRKPQSIEERGGARIGNRHHA